MTVNERIAALRSRMHRYGLNAYVVPSSDPHQSEYLAAHWKSREWLSGFTGSAGVLVVTPDHAGLWTDSRYFLQAEQQLRGTELVLHRQLVPHAPEHVTWMATMVPEGGVVGCDGNLFSLGQLRYLEKQFSSRGIAIHSDLDLIKDIWKDRPPLPAGPVFELDVAYVGQSRADKLRLIRENMNTQGVAHYLISTLDDIAWTLNLRGDDVECNPFFISYVFIDPNHAHLFIDPAKVPEAVRQALSADGVRLHPYAAIEPFLGGLPAGEPVLVDPQTISVQLYQVLNTGYAFPGDNIPRSLKAIKNGVETGHIRRAMLKDGVALVRLYRWLEETLARTTVTEHEVARRLDDFRREQGDYFGESFAAIVGYQANGAIVHYRPDPEHSAVIRPEGILLLDSGGQYIDGTTDITRTTALSEPTVEQRRDFTLVLKGHIALATAMFPEGTIGIQLDALARAPLWREGLNYGHGTGHGVGFFLSVHEPPQGFATNATTSRGTTAFVPGMLTSNEPGLYREGAYGIRIENLVLCVEGPRVNGEQFLKFETLTIFPIDMSLVEPGMLTSQEKEWLNGYQGWVLKQLSPLLKEDEVRWLEQKCGVAG